MIHIEHQIQKAIIQRLKLARILCFAIPNGGRRNLKEAVRLKAEGVLAGVSDIEIVLKNRIVFVEVKTGKGKQTENQKDFEKLVTELGHEYYVWRSVDDADKFIKDKRECKDCVHYTEATIEADQLCRECDNVFSKSNFTKKEMK